MDEQSKIMNTTVSAGKNPKYVTDPGSATTDKVFLLSINEAGKYFPSDSERQCKATKYAEAQGTNVNSSDNCWWWLRSPGNFQSRAAGVNYDGSIFSNGHYVDYGTYAVRPVLWINLKS